MLPCFIFKLLAFNSLLISFNSSTDVDFLVPLLESLSVLVQLVGKTFLKSLTLTLTPTIN